MRIAEYNKEIFLRNENGLSEEEIKQALREEIDYNGVSVVIARRECIQTLKRHLKEAKK